ncbi:hypothetical protein AVEN_125290-1 [Araneus ventricosus]|uniref:Uncharacterized protein n=1 Tax=Araneus ventricosus TaxID=182803 RepID=A0A4Y2EL94_ARAVE|nr:hypothetical protein AVEN_125290-1 [Araneus ventricosus]
MRYDDIVNVMYRENFPRFSQSACAQRFFNSEKAMQGNKISRQIAFAELRSATSSVGSRRKKLLDDHVNWPSGYRVSFRTAWRSSRMRSCRISKQVLAPLVDTVMVVWLLGPTPDDGSYPGKMGVVGCAARNGGYYAGTTKPHEIVAAGHDEN